MGHKELMLQTRLTSLSSSMINRPLPMLGTPRKTSSSSLEDSQRKLHTRPWCSGLKTIWWLYSLSSIVTIGADIRIQIPVDFMNDTLPFNPLLEFAIWTSQEAYLPPAFHTQMGFQKVLNSLCIPPTTAKHQVTMVLALGLMIQDIMCAVEIEPDQCPPGVPEWVASSQLTVKHLEALLKMVPTLTTLSEW